MPAFDRRISAGRGRRDLAQRHARHPLLPGDRARRLGISAFLGIGGDPVLGTTTREALALLERDPGTEAIVMMGEIGGSMEERRPSTPANMTKPVVAFIAGGASPAGKGWVTQARS